MSVHRESCGARAEQQQQQQQKTNSQKRQGSTCKGLELLGAPKDKIRGWGAAGPLGKAAETGRGGQGWSLAAFGPASPRGGNTQIYLFK